MLRNEQLINKIDDKSKAQFISLLEDKKYRDATLLFYELNSLSTPTFITFFPRESAGDDVSCAFQAMIHDIGSSIAISNNPNTKVSSNLIIEMIEHLHRNTNVLQLEKDFYPLLYINYYEVNNEIGNWNAVENKIVEYFKPELDFDYILFCAIKWRRIPVVEYLLSTSKANIVENNWYWVKEHKHVSYNLEVFNENKFERINPLFGTIRLAENDLSSDEDVDFADHLKILEFMIQHDPRCVKIKDFDGTDFSAYLKALINATKNFVEKMPLNNVHVKANKANARIEKHCKNYLTFFQGTKDDKSNLSMLIIDELRQHIGMLAIKTGM